jgi:hypothetical protein
LDLQIASACRVLRVISAGLGRSSLLASPTPSISDQHARCCPALTHTQSEEPVKGFTKWESQATTDPDQIYRWWLDGPYNIGVATGPSQLVVVDCDVPRGSGEAHWCLFGKRSRVTGHRFAENVLGWHAKWRLAPVLDGPEAGIRSSYDETSMLFETLGRCPDPSRRPGTRHR